MQAALGREGIVEGVDYRGVPVIADVRRVPDSPWFLVARMDTSEVYAPLRERLWEIVGLAGVLLLGAAGATGLVWRQQNMRFYRERYRAAEALRWSENQLQVTLEATADGILTVDNRGKVLRVNRRFAELWRVPQSLLTNRDDQALLAFVLSQLSEPEAFLKKVQSLYGSAETDLDTLFFKDGRCFERYSSPMLIEGAVIGRVWAFRDITERRRVDESLRNSEANYRALFTHSADGILIADLETKMFKYANPAICHLLGYTEDEFRTLNVSNISPKDALSHVVAEFEAQARGEKTLAAALSFLRKDGTIIYADVNATTVTIDDRQCLVGFFRDVTERRRADDAAHREKNLNQDIVDSLPGLFYILDEHGHSLRWNRALSEVSGYSDEVSPACLCWISSRSRTRAWLPREYSRCSQPERPSSKAP